MRLSELDEKSGTDTFLALNAALIDDPLFRNVGLITPLTLRVENVSWH